MLALPAPVQRSPTRLHQSAPIRSSTSSTPIGTLTTAMATNGCTLWAQLFSLTRTRESTSLPRRELTVGTSPSRPRPPEQFLWTSLKMSGLCNSTGRLLPSSTTLPHTPTATSPFLFYRGRYFPRRRHFLEWLLSLHRLFNGRQYRRHDPCY